MIMINNILGKCKDVFIYAINKLKGSERRIALAKISKKYGMVEKHLYQKLLKLEEIQ
jgi:hypothetical protein